MPLKVIPRRDRKLNRVIKKATSLELRRGQTLFRAGEPATELFLVRFGHIRLVSPGPGGKGTPRSGRASEGSDHRKGKVVAIAGPGELLGEEALLSETPRRWEALAGEETQVLSLRGRGTQQALQTSPKTFQAFLESKEAELALARALSASRRPGGAKARLGALLLHLGTRMSEKDQKAPSIPISLTHQLLADLSDAHRSTVTTLLNEWIYEGILKAEGNGFRILKPKALEME